MVKKKLGLGFPDEVAKVSLRNKTFKRPIIEDWKDLLLPNFDPGELMGADKKSIWRTSIFIGVAIVFFFIIFVRLFHLQIVNGEENRKLADGNRIQIKVIHAPRGVIYDRNGKVLASNSPGFRLVDPESSSVTFISREDAFELEVKNDPRAQNLEVDTIRHYPQGEAFSHVLGYAGEITKQQLEDPKYSGIKAGDRIGQAGVEAHFENVLRGVDGGEIIEVDATGKKLHSLRKIAPIPGKNLYLTIDSDLQQVSYRYLKETIAKSKSCCGVLVAGEPGSGAILAFALSRIFGF